MSKVYAKFPKTGLGNLMLVWARACVFAHLNNLPLVTSSWWGFRPGAWIRNEKKKRVYWGYFKESPLRQKLWMRWYEMTKTVIHEPPVKKLNDVEIIPNRLYVFDTVIVENDLFSCLRNYQHIVKDNMYKLISSSVRKQLTKSEIPVIAVHIRRGDFKKGNPVTPDSFFIECIQSIREAANETLPVTIFTDAGKEEVKNILALPATQLSASNTDILDILLMSKSKILVTSRSSTFSYWAAFLSEAIVVMSTDDWQQKIKDETKDSQYREIRWAPGNSDAREVLMNAIEELRYKREFQ